MKPYWIEKTQRGRKPAATTRREIDAAQREADEDATESLYTTTCRSCPREIDAGLFCEPCLDTLLAASKRGEICDYCDGSCVLN
jgi:hypothetical protein